MASRGSGSSSAVVLEEPAVISFAAIPPSVPIVSIENGAARTLGISGPIPGDDDQRSIRSGDRDGKPDPGPDAAGAAQKLPPTAAALIMASLGLSALLSALDITIVTTAMPVIAAEFHSNAAYIWIGSSYVLASTAIAPVWGSVADIWGRKPIMLIALAVFLGGSLMCALAETMDTMIIGRVFQGFGTSGKAVVGSIIISDLFPLRDRGLYLAVLSTVWAVGASAGPLLGGVLTTKLSWRWCFWINLPVGALVFVALLVFLKVPNPHTPMLKGLKAIDWLGVVLIMGGALMLLMGLDFGNVTYPWSSPTVIALIASGIVVIALFIYNEWKLTHNPIVPLRLFKTVSTSAAFGVLSLNFFVFNGIAYYLPLYSQSVLGANALTAGIYLVPIIASTCIASAFAAIMIQKTGKYRVFMHVAQVLLTLGVGLLINLDLETNITNLVIYEIITGLGTGLNDEAPTIAALAGTSERDAAATISLMSFLQNLGSVVSIVIGGVTFQNEMDAAGSSLTAALGEPLASQFSGAQAASNLGLIHTLPADQQTIVRRAYFDSMKKVWIMYVAFAGLATVLNLFVRGHKLSKERGEVVLGVDRHDAEATQTATETGPNAIELRARRRPETSAS